MGESPRDVGDGGINPPAAAKTQTKATLITMLMLRWMQPKSFWWWSMSNLMAPLLINSMPRQARWRGLDKSSAALLNSFRSEQVAMAF